MKRWLVVVIAAMSTAACAASLGAGIGVSHSSRGVTRGHVEAPVRLVFRGRSAVHTTNDARFFVMEADPMVTYRPSDGQFGIGILGGMGGSFHAGRTGGTATLSFGVLLDGPEGLRQPRMFLRLQLGLERELGESDWRIHEEENCAGRSGSAFVPNRSPHRMVGVGPALLYLFSAHDSNVNMATLPSEWVVSIAATYRKMWEPKCLGPGP